jgi:hypothetical protein
MVSEPNGALPEPGHDRLAEVIPEDRFEERLERAGGRTSRRSEATLER